MLATGAEQRRRSGSDLEPACSRTDSDWRPEPVTGGLLAFHSPCQQCFPKHGPEEGADTTIRQVLKEIGRLCLPESSHIVS